VDYKRQDRKVHIPLQTEPLIPVKLSHPFRWKWATPDLVYFGINSRVFRAKWATRFWQMTVIPAKVSQWV